MDLNNVQKLISEISGYHPDECGAKDDGYYSQKKGVERLNYLKEYVKSVAEYNLSYWEIVEAQEFLEMEFSSADRKHKEFLNVYK